MNKLMNVKEVAGVLGVQPSTIYQWTCQGYIPHKKLGNLVRFDEDEIRKWLDTKSNRGRTSRRIDIEF